MHGRRLNEPYRRRPPAKVHRSGRTSVCVHGDWASGRDEVAEAGECVSVCVRAVRVNRPIMFHTRARAPRDHRHSSARSAKDTTAHLRASMCVCVCDRVHLCVLCASRGRILTVGCALPHCRQCRCDERIHEPVAGPGPVAPSTSPPPTAHMIMQVSCYSCGARHMDARAPVPHPTRQ